MSTDRSNNYELTDAELDTVSAGSYGKIDVSKLMAYKGETCPKDTGTGAFAGAVNYIETALQW